MNPLKSQIAFAAGELDPSLHSRVDMERHGLGLRTLRNAWVKRSGGVQNRPGTEYVGHTFYKGPWAPMSSIHWTTTNSSLPPGQTYGEYLGVSGHVVDSFVRFVPFEFNDAQTYLLEFGPGYMRPIRNGDFIYRAPQNIVNIQEVDGQLESTVMEHGLSTADGITPMVYISGIRGVTGLNGRFYKVLVKDDNTLILVDMLKNRTVSSTDFPGIYSSGGTIEVVVVIAAPFETQPELESFQASQSADTIVMVHPDHAPMKLYRTSETEWAIDKILFRPSIDSPTDLVTSKPSGFAYYYKVSAIGPTGEESLPSELIGVDGVPTPSTPNILKWSNVDSGLQYIIYAGVNGLFGRIGMAASGLDGFLDVGYSPDMTSPPILDRQPFDVDELELKATTDLDYQEGTGGRRSAWSPDGQLLAIGRATAPRLSLYWRKGGKGSLKLVGSALPTGEVTDMEFSSTGQFLMVATKGAEKGILYAVAYTPAGVPYLQNTDVLGYLGGPMIDFTHFTTGEMRACSFCKSGYALLTGYTGAPYASLYYYKYSPIYGWYWEPHLLRSTDDGNYPDLNNWVFDFAFAPNDMYVSIITAHLTTKVCIYKHCVLPWVDITPVEQPSFTATRSAWSPDMKYLVVIGSSAPFITAYSVSGTTFTLLTDAFVDSEGDVSVPEAVCWGLSWSADSRYLAVASVYGDKLYVYENNGDDTFTLLDCPSGIPDLAAYDVEWSPNQEYLTLIQDGDVSLLQFQSMRSFPSVVAFSPQGRLQFANSKAAPNRYWASVAGSPFNFTFHLPLVDSDSIQADISGPKVNAIRHILYSGRHILLTQGGELAHAGGILTPTNLEFIPQSGNGAAVTIPVQIDNDILYVQGRGKKIRDFNMNESMNGDFRGDDITVLAAHLFRDSTIRGMVFQQNPQPVLWVWKWNGELLSCTFLREQGIIAWAHHDTDGVVEGMGVIPEDDEDGVYLSVLRKTGDDTHRFIERMATRDALAVADYCFLDCAFLYDGTATATITGLEYLEGANVAVWADGFMVANPHNPDYDVITVTNGQITLPRAYSKVWVGLPFISDVETLGIDMLGNSPVGEETKNVSRLWLHVEETRGLMVGSVAPEDAEDTDNTPTYGLQKLDESLTDEVAPASQVTPIALLSGDLKGPVPGNHTSHGRIFIRQIDAVPFTICAVQLYGKVAD